MKTPIGPAACRGPGRPQHPAAEDREGLVEQLFARAVQALRLKPPQARHLRPGFEDSRLVKLGLDSLGALELRHALFDDTGIELSLEELLGPATVRQLVVRLQRALAARDLMEVALAAEETEAWTL